MNKQTNSAVSMLVRAYRCILHNAHTSSLYGSKSSRSKCLAASMTALLGALSLSYSPASTAALFATQTITEENLSDVSDQYTSGGVVSVKVSSGSAFDLAGNVNFNFNTVASEEPPEDWEEENGSILISSIPDSDDKNIAYGMHFKRDKNGSGSGSFSLSAVKDMVIEANNHALSLENDVNVNLNASGSLTISSASLDNDNDDKNGDAINVSNKGNGNITLSGSTVKLSAGSGTMGDGIYVDEGAYSNIDTKEEESVISITGTDGITIEVGNNGIDHRGNGTIELTSSLGTNTITAGSGSQGYDEDGIRIQGSGSVILSGTANSLTATDAGLFIEKDSSSGAKITLTAKSGNNSITTNRYGVQAEAGAIELKASGKNTINSDYVGVTATGANTSITIASSGSGTNTITVSGGTTSSDTKANSDIAFIRGLEAASGATVNFGDSLDEALAIEVDAGGAIRGIEASAGGLVNLSGSSLELTVTNTMGGQRAYTTTTQDDDTYGIKASGADKSLSGSNVNIATAGDINITVEGIDTSSITRTNTTTEHATNTYGINATSGATVALNSQGGSITISTSNDAYYSENYNGAAIYATSGSKVSLSAASGTNSSLGSVFAGGSGSTVNYSAHTNIFSSSAIV